MDLRSLQHEFSEELVKISSEEFSAAFGSILSENNAIPIKAKVASTLLATFNATSTMDATERMQEVAASSTTPLLDFFTGPSFSNPSLVGPALTSIPTFRARVASRACFLLDELRKSYLSGARGAAPASRYLNRTRLVYEFVRLTLGIRMHGSENYHRFVNGLGVDDVTIGQNISLIHEVRIVYVIFYSSFNSYPWSAGYSRWETSACHRGTFLLNALAMNNYPSGTNTDSPIIIYYDTHILYVFISNIVVYSQYKKLLNFLVFLTST